MTSAEQPTPPGFYPDPQGGASRRWWDGTKWTETLEGSAWTTPVGPDGRPIQPELPAGTKYDSAFIWIFSIIPLLTLVQLLIMDFGGVMRAALEQPSNPFAIYTPGYLAASSLSFLFYAGSVLLAYLDRDRLQKLGVVQPFHWAWALLSSLVYAIGRAVVLRRRVGAGMAPLWVYIAGSVITTSIVLVMVVSAISTALESFRFS
ncbi:DUF2510 domain-containing protein [Herbiconiux sp. L3-i23]|uniref:DUF2510 domain-containing protein n=1 Tax=Herbiconiux sp. L3-i23 TaxID=2905871 RepID=UPI002044FAAC|nr:DUF2510 domain-containing protein [Herbiconiux sp. L3-i23]BDI21805.1 hypothetical protein L3i23_05810 [Herbiconiux sp. L3-i23]